MDIYIKQAIIHQFTPEDTDLVFSGHLLTITPKIEAYLRKKVERAYSEEAKTGSLETDNSFLYLLSEDLLDSSLKVAKRWQEEFSISDHQKTNDLLFLHYEKNGVNHFGFLRIALRENLAHIGLDDGQPLQTTQNNLPSAGAAPDEAFLLNLSTLQYHLLEKRIKYNGVFLHYFSENVLQTEPVLSPKKSIKEVEKVAQKIAQDFHQNDFQFQSKVKSAIFQELEAENALSPEKLANQLFDENLTARLSFVDQLKDVVPETISFTEIDNSRQLKKFENQKLSLSNGIELIVPDTVYRDAESVEFIQNENGTYSILIKNIENIENKS